MKNVALFLRAKILEIQDKDKQPSPMTLDDILKGQCKNIPCELLDFYRIMYTGHKEEAADRIERYVEASAEDDIYKATCGKVEPSKHILLGMGLKSITGSRKVQEVINHFGHSIGYHTAEEYETQIAEQIIERKQVLPDGLQPKKGLSTNSAWDNYDESMYHDTQGIVIQNNFSIAPSMTEEVSVRSEKSSGSSLLPKRRHKRSLDIPNTELEPVRKNSRYHDFCLMYYLWRILQITVFGGRSLSFD